MDESERIWPSVSSFDYTLLALHFIHAVTGYHSLLDTVQLMFYLVMMYRYVFVL
jgi:hypothetical protein